MELTQEQKDIIQSTGNIKINAVAGSGKTTTIIEYARSRPEKSSILYIAFNKSVKLEAIKKFAEKGLHHVKVETAHSLAYKHIVYRNKYTVKAQGYKTNEVVEILNLKGTGEKLTEYVLANHINKLVAFFCNSEIQKVQDLKYFDTITDPKAKSFVMSFYPYIKQQSRIFLSKMDTGEIDITHDFYLKKFQLSNPMLFYDYILFDEGQDASAVMLDIFSKQKATKVIVGDTHQQIYGWRYAVNSLEKADFKTFQLSTSFRFSQDIANLAMEVLQWKSHIDDYQKIPITGMGRSREIKTKAVLGRTNLGLLLKAIEYVFEKKKVKNIYFEGNINSYTYADDGASLYDVLSLYNKRYSSIKDSLIKEMKNLEELEEYIKKTEDVQLGMMVEIVKQYGNEIPGIIKTIKEKHIDNDEKEKAEMIFSTVHRCKGMEYDAVQLVNDFITKEKLEKLKEEEKKLNGRKLAEEINLLYVAITRTKNTLYIPETLMPVELPKSSRIHVTKVLSKEEKENEKINETSKKINQNLQPKQKTYTLSEVRKKYQGAYLPWTPELDKELTEMFCKGAGEAQLAKHFGRTRGAISSRIKRLELHLLYGK